MKLIINGIDVCPIVVKSGSHSNRTYGMCIMELAAYLAGRNHTDHPVCVAPPLTSLMMELNDSNSDKFRNEMKILLPDVLGTWPVKDISKFSPSNSIALISSHLDKEIELYIASLFFEFERYLVTNFQPKRKGLIPNQDVIRNAGLYAEQIDEEMLSTLFIPVKREKEVREALFTLTRKAAVYARKRARAYCKGKPGWYVPIPVLNGDNK